MASGWYVVVVWRVFSGWLDCFRCGFCGLLCCGFAWLVAVALFCGLRLVLGLLWLVLGLASPDALV